jgi:GR25 family glycosyltransferase involved in LPS biosynthesis
MEFNTFDSIFNSFEQIIQNPEVPEDKILECYKQIGAFSNLINHDKFCVYDKKYVDKLTNNLSSSDKTNKTVTITMTTCKRFDLMQKTINSFLHCCLDLDLIFDWIVIDDNSSEEDKKMMKELYPFITYYFKTPEVKGHALSMNLILELVKTPYMFHLEDDWKFIYRDNYLTKCIQVVNINEKFGQCLLNRAYSEDLVVNANLITGYPRYDNKIKYYIHEHVLGPTMNDIANKYIKNGYSNCVYWPNYSLRPGITKLSVLREIGKFNTSAQHFEMEYAERYSNKKYRTCYLPNIYCIHIGRKTYERDSNLLNAYDLNNEQQFGEKPKTNENKIEEKVQLPFVSQEEIDKFLSNTKINILNLKRRKDRLESFLNNNANKFLNNMKLCIFEAVDGQALKPNQKIQRLFKNNDYNFRKGIIGCALSHIKMWCEIFTDNNMQGMLNIEDDAILTPDCILKLIYCIKNSPEADIIFLGHHPYPQYRDDKNYKTDIWPITEKWDLETCKRQSMGGTTAYYITKRGCINMMKHINENGMVNAIDWEMFKTANVNNIYYCSPYIAFAECFQNDTKTDTDIQFDYSNVAFKDVSEILLSEIDYWKEKGINKFDTIEFPEFSNLSTTENSKIYLRSENSFHLDNNFIKSLSVMKYSEKLVKKLLLYPVVWYMIDNYIFVVPEPMIQSTLLQDKTLYSNYLHQDCNIY